MPCCLFKFQSITSKCATCRTHGSTEPAIQSNTPATDDAKSERIRQLHNTLSAIIDERDDLLDQLEGLSQSDLATELETAQSEIMFLREQVEFAA